MGNNESSDVPRGGCVVAVEGNIGAGKSTRCKLLQERLGGPDKVLVLEEDILGHWILEAYYREPQKYAYKLHKKTIKMNYRSMVLAETAASAGKIVIMDRCLLGVWVFINANLGNMTPKQAVKINRLFNEMINDAPKPNLVVHLTTDPEQCLANIKQRNRRGEEKISLEYLQQLEQYHTEVLYDKNYGVPVMRLEFGPITDEHVARIHACRPYLLPPVKNEDAGGDDSDAEPLPGGWSFTDEKAD
jgi:deoxyadenosine/deoxycytidine kinase